MMKQYGALKREHADALLLFRCGDFYETYCEDAEEVGRLLNIVVTRKGAGADGDVAMAGVPYHAIETYLAKLVRMGRRVAIAEQMEDPKFAKGLVKREVVRVVSPGTAVDDALLEERANNYLVSLCRGPEGRWGVALVDFSTGFFSMTEVPAEDAGDRLLTELASLEVREIVLAESEDATILQPLLVEKAIAITRRSDRDFAPREARALLLEHLHVQSLEGYGAEDLAIGVRAAGGMLRYLRDTQKASLRHLAELRVHHGQRGMMLDAVTQRSLELVANLHGGTRQGTLLEVLDRTLTPMGARTLRRWILQPLSEREDVERRLEAVGVLVANASLRTNLGESLKRVRDLERIASRASLGTATPRDLVALRASLERLPDVRGLLEKAGAPLLQELGAGIDPLGDLKTLLSRALVDEPPVTFTDGGVIRPGYSKDLDELHSVAHDSRAWIAAFRAREADRTGIDKLKVGYNKVFGYYLELTHAQIRQLPGGEPPEGWIRKQTLANAERYITPELKEREDMILHAEERMNTLEASLFVEVRNAVAEQAATILRNAAHLADADCLRCLGEVAVAQRYVKPEMADDGALDIVDGRHPVIEALQVDPPFVANDTALGGEHCQIALITGPNMAGKSTYIRQVALVVLLAHMGSFVPASRARIPMVDRIFTRVGAMDHLARGQSTFLVEMTETANILRHATSRSLVILDEIGRGTSTYDGLAIAWGVCEFLHNTPARNPMTLFATHYHELTSLEGPLPKLRNLHVAVLEEKQRIVFLYKILPGATDRSYGVHAAEFAGVPGEVVARAQEILGLLERGEPVAPRVASGDVAGTGAAKGRKRAQVLPTAEAWENKQLGLFDNPQPHPVVERLKALDPNRLTPLEALAVLAELRRLAGE